MINKRPVYFERLQNLKWSLSWCILSIHFKDHNHHLEVREKLDLEVFGLPDLDQGSRFENRGSAVHPQAPSMESPQSRDTVHQGRRRQ